MEKAINIVLGLVKDRLGKYGTGSKLNLAISDGSQVIVTRFRNSSKAPPSLYFTLRQKDAKTLHGSDTLSTMLSFDDEKQSTLNLELTCEQILDRPMYKSFGYSKMLLPEVVMIASEPVDREEEELWKLVPRNTIISIKRLGSGGLEVDYESMNV